jgi:hypothetical protein
MTQTDVFKTFSEPILNSMINNCFSRNCSEFSDEQFVLLGIRRVLGEDKSGRAFLQRLHMENITDVEISNFFKSIKSNRRLRHLKKLFQMFTANANKRLMEFDRLIVFSELAKFEIFAADGSYVEWACHDEKILSSKAMMGQSDNRVAKND